MGKNTQFEPIELNEIKLILKAGDLDAISAKREKILKSLGIHLQNQRQEVSNYLSKEVFEKATTIIKEFCEERGLAVVPYFDFSRISVSLCDANEYKKFMDYDRDTTPALKTREFDELHEKINQLGKCRIVGELSNNKLIWNIKAMITGELKEKADHLDKIISLAQQKMTEIDAKKLEEAKKKEQMIEKYPPNK